MHPLLVVLVAVVFTLLAAQGVSWLIHRSDSGRLARIAQCDTCRHQVCTVTAKTSWGLASGEGFVGEQMRQHSHDCPGLGTRGGPLHHRWHWVNQT